MPILNALEDFEWRDPDDVDRPIVVFGAAMSDVGGFELEPRRHRKAQLLYVQRGALSCEVESGLWIVPPRSAIWIPGGALHAIKATGALEGYNAFVDPAVDTLLPVSCCAVSVTPLLRELLTRAAHLPYAYDERGSNARLVAVLLDEIAMAQVEDLHLPADRSAPARHRRRDDGLSGNPGHVAELGGACRHEPANPIARDQPRDGHELRSLAPAARGRPGGKMAGGRRVAPAGQ